VDEADIAQIREGQSVEITLDAFVGAKGEGEIVYLSPLAQSDSGIVTYEVRVDIVRCDVPLREGLTVNANVVTELFEDRLTVPNSAIMIDDETGDKYVARRTAAGTELVRIETGYYNDMVSEVLSGLSEGDLVLRRSTSYRERFREMMRGSFPGAQ
jgi:HlyD family secretion protein